MFVNHKSLKRYDLYLIIDTKGLWDPRMRPRVSNIGGVYTWFIFLIAQKRLSL